MELLAGSSFLDSWEVLIDCEPVSSGAEVAELCCSSGLGLADTDEVGSSS